MSRTRRIVSGLAMVWSKVTLEPSMFVLALASKLDAIPLTELLIYKTCINKFNFTEEICENLLEEQNHDYNQQVQYEFTKYNIILSVLQSVLPTFAGLYFGAWCDLFGRKFLMAVFFAAQLIGYVILQANAYWRNGPPEFYVVHVIPVALIGGVGALWTARNLFISDITSPEKRAFRFSMLFFCSSIANPIGTYAGAHIYTKFGLVACLTTSLVVQILGVTIMFWKIRHIKYKPPREVKISCGTIFDPNLVKDSVRIAFKKRPGRGRFIIFFILVGCFFLYAPDTGEVVINYVLLRDRFKWGPTDIATFQATMELWIIVVQVVVNPVIKLVRIDELKMLIFFTALRVTSDTLVFFANEPAMMYFAKAVDVMSLYGHFIIASLFSCCAPVEELGRVNAIFSISDNFNPLIVGPLYRELYKMTAESMLGAPYLVSATSGLIFIAMMSYLVCIFGGRHLSEVTGYTGNDLDEMAEKETEENHEISEEQRSLYDNYTRARLSLQDSVRFKSFQGSRVTTEL